MLLTCIAVMCFALVVLTAKSPNVDISDSLLISTFPKATSRAAIFVTPIMLEEPLGKSQRQILSDLFGQPTGKSSGQISNQSSYQLSGQKQITKINRLVYEFGTRTKYDVRLPQTEKNVANSSVEPWDYVVEFTFNNTDEKVSFMEIMVKQTSYEGSVAISKVVGSNASKVHIEAKKSYSFEYIANFYLTALKTVFATIGHRTCNDVVLARVHGSIQYSQPTKVSKIITYPGTTNDKLKDKKITYVLVTSQQTAENMTACVTRGELKKSSKDFAVTVEINKTMEFTYEVVFYSFASRCQPFIVIAILSFHIIFWNLS